MFPSAVRRLRVWRDAEGRLHRKTEGESPRGWRKQHSWDVPDGPIAP